MLRKLPGIDIPAATEVKILHAAAFLEFKQHVERLVCDGSHTAAYTCWMHAVERTTTSHTRFWITTRSLEWQGTMLQMTGSALKLGLKKGHRRQPQTCSHPSPCSEDHLQDEGQGDQV